MRTDTQFMAALAFSIGGALTLAAFGGCPSGNNNIGGDPFAGDGGGCATSGTDNAAATVRYSIDILPIFQTAGCLAAGCHGGSFVSSNFELGTYDDMFKQGEEASILGLCAVKPGDADSSYLMQKLRGFPPIGDPMPLLLPPLTETQLATIETWINEGAPNN